MRSVPKISVDHDFSPYMQGNFVKIIFAQEVTECCMPPWDVRRLDMGVKGSLIGVKSRYSRAGQYIGAN